MPLTCSRTIMEFESAWITSALSQFPFSAAPEAPGLLTTIGADIVTCPRAAAAAIRPPTSIEAAKILKFFIEGYLQRLQKLDVLGGHLDLRIAFLFLENLFVDANVQGFKETPVLLGHFRIGRAAARKPDGGIELQHDVESRSAYAGNCLRDAFRFRHGVVDRVSQLPQQLLHPVVELQGRGLLV